MNYPDNSPQGWRQPLQEPQYPQNQQPNGGNQWPSGYAQQPNGYAQQPNGGRQRKNSAKAQRNAAIAQSPEMQWLNALMEQVRQYFAPCMRRSRVKGIIQIVVCSICGLASYMLSFANGDDSTAILGGIAVIVLFSLGMWRGERWCAILQLILGGVVLLATLVTAFLSLGDTLLMFLMLCDLVNGTARVILMSLVLADRQYIEWTGQLSLLRRATRELTKYGALSDGTRQQVQQLDNQYRWFGAQSTVGGGPTPGQNA